MWMWSFLHDANEHALLVGTMSGAICTLQWTLESFLEEHLFTMAATAILTEHVCNALAYLPVSLPLTMLTAFVETMRWRSVFLLASAGLAILMRCVFGKSFLL